MSSCSIEDLLVGFTASGGWINEKVFGLQPFEAMGYGAVALEEVQVSMTKEYTHK
jgi:hypothetical protein